MPSSDSPQTNEFALIDWIRRNCRQLGYPGGGIGDDCAVEPQQSGRDLLTTTDLLIEGVHFKLEWTDFRALGRKSAAVNLSDIAAMGGTPEALFLALGRPREVSDAAIKEFLAGFIEETEEYGAVLAGGDTCASPGPLLISVTAHGRVASGRAILRRGARPADSVYVSGCLGDSALALELLQRGEMPPEALAERFHRPRARVELGRQLAEQQLASAMLDISDGLLADLGHLLQASEVGAEIQLERIPLSPDFAAACSVSPELIDLALSGGEDYELVLTAATDGLAEQPLAAPGLTYIGQIKAEPGLRIRTMDGRNYQCRRAGFDHFA